MQGAHGGANSAQPWGSAVLRRRPAVSPESIPSGGLGPLRCPLFCGGSLLYTRQAPAYAPDGHGRDDGRASRASCATRARSDGRGRSDPGHGGGNRAASVRIMTHEKSVTLDLAEDFTQIADSTPGVRVVLTRRDVDVPLSERVAIANASNADLFISIHANASPGRDQAGYETFVLDASAASDDASARTSGPRRSESSRQDANPMLRDWRYGPTFDARVSRAGDSARHEPFPDRLDRGASGTFDVLRGLDAGDLDRGWSFSITRSESGFGPRPRWTRWRGETRTGWPRFVVGPRGWARCAPSFAG